MIDPHPIAAAISQALREAGVNADPLISVTAEASRTSVELGVDVVLELRPQGWELRSRRGVIALIDPATPPRDIAAAAVGALVDSIS